MFCSRPLVYDDDTWAFQASPDQLGCNQILKTLGPNIEGAKALHVGIGNSSILLQFAQQLRQLDGITIMDSEIRVANGVRPLFDLEYRVFKINKYDAGLIHKLDPDYDIVIDNNLKQHACCQNHWVDYFYAALDRVTPRGFLLTHTQGFAPHSPLVNALSIPELQKLLRTGPQNIADSFVLSEMKLMCNEEGHYPVSIERKI